MSDKPYIDPVWQLNDAQREARQKMQVIHSVNISVSKREYFALHLLGSYMQSVEIWKTKFDDETVKSVVDLADRLIRVLKETEHA